MYGVNRNHLDANDAYLDLGLSKSYSFISIASLGTQVLSDSDELIVISEISYKTTMDRIKFKRTVYSLFNVGSAVGGLLNVLVRIFELLSYVITTQQLFKHIVERVY